jgi:hypothetical protein
MNEISNQYLIIFRDGRIEGFENRESVEDYLQELRENRIIEYCDREDVDFEKLTKKAKKEILLEIGSGTDVDKIYKTSKVIQSVKKANIEANVKDELLYLLTEYSIEFFIEDYEGLEEIFDEVDDIEI